MKVVVVVIRLSISEKKNYNLKIKVQADLNIPQNQLISKLHGKRKNQKLKKIRA